MPAYSSKHPPHGVIIVVEGPSAAGKTTWIAAHCQPGTARRLAGQHPTGTSTLTAQRHTGPGSAPRAGMPLVKPSRAPERPSVTPIRSSSTTYGHFGGPAMPAAANGTPNSTPPASCSPRAASASPTSSSSRSPGRPPWPPAARQIQPAAGGTSTSTSSSLARSATGITRWSNSTPRECAGNYPPPASRTPSPDPATTAPGLTSSMHSSANSLPGKP